MCCTLSMTKCQCHKPPAHRAPLCRGVPRSTFAFRLAALRRNNTSHFPSKESASSSFPFIYFSGSMLFTSVSPPVDFSMMSSLRTQANVNTCKRLRNAPPTQSGRWMEPQPANSANALVSLYLFCLVSMRSGTVQSLHHSQASVNPSNQYLDTREDLLLIRVCFRLLDALVLVLVLQWRFIVMHWETNSTCCHGPQLPPCDLFVFKWSLQKLLIVILMTLIVRCVQIAFKSFAS